MLHGIRVLDLTMHLSGPYCTWLLASLGADVIKVERPDGGDPARKTGPLAQGESTYFGSVNRNKRSVALDLKAAQGKETFAALVKTSDVLVENFRPGVLARLGFDEARLRSLNPDLVYASISGFGQQGPMSGLPAFDIVIQAMSGIMSITGRRDGDPTAVGFSVADATTGVFAALDIVAALFERERTGRARRVDVAMLDCQLALLENAVGRYLNTGEVAGRMNSRHPKIAPFQPYRTRDGTIVVAADGEAAWRRFCRCLGRDELLADPRFSDNDARVAHRDELDAILATVFATRDSAEWLALLRDADIACGPVNGIAQALGMEQVAHRRMVSEVVRRDGARFRYAASPLGPRDGRAERAAPAYGEHTAEILQDLGLDGAAQAAPST